MKPALALLLVALMMGGSVVARDTGYQYAPPIQGEGEAERLLNSPRGQELKGVVDLMMKGDREAAEQALQAYRKKYNADPSGSMPGAVEQARPSQPFDFGPPMMLPPEAR